MGGARPACACCGENQLDFLTLDHVHGDGGAERRRQGSHHAIYKAIVHKGDMEGLRVLCFNCNLARGLYGACPHAPNPDAAVASAAVQPPRMMLCVSSAAQPSPLVKACTACGVSKDASEFYSDQGTRSGLQSRCRTCTYQGARRRAALMRVAALRHYGGQQPRCTCCGEGEIQFLALDHIEGNGQAHRRQLGARGGSDFYRLLMKAGFPPGLQVLCHNCNGAEGQGTQCPHSAPRSGSEGAVAVSSI